MDISIVLPCLNEAETLEVVIKKCMLSIRKSGLKGEVIVADNGSTDGSQDIAVANGARLIHVPKKGYGAALQAGIQTATGKMIVMGDADDSYALEEIQPFISKLNDGYDLVMGDRFAGGIEAKAMPWLHKYLGNPVLSWLGRLFFKVPISDFHCGLRGFNKESISRLNLSATGMEFASEMVVKASLNNLKITEVPTTLRPDGRSRAPHLRTWRDGWRHLIFLLVASPRWLFLYPGIFMSLLGIFGMSITSVGSVSFGDTHLDLNTYFLSLAVLLVGLQTILMAILARVFSTHHSILPRSKNINLFEKYFRLEKGIFLGIVLIVLSIAGATFLYINWTGSGFRNLGNESSLRISGLLILSFVSGIQVLFASFFASMLGV